MNSTLLATLTTLGGILIGAGVASVIQGAPEPCPECPVPVSCPATAPCPPPAPCVCQPCAACPTCPACVCDACPPPPACPECPIRAVPDGVDPTYARMLGPADWPFKAENSKGCSFIMTNPEPRGRGSIEAVAQVRNMSGKTWGAVGLAYVLLDKDGNVGDIASDMLSNVSNGDIRTVEFTFRNLPPGFQAGMGRLEIKHCLD